MALDYCTYADLAAYLIGTGIESSTAYEDHLGNLITAASREIDHYCGRWDGFFYNTTSSTATAEERYFDGDGEDEQWIDHCLEIITLSVAESGDLDTYTEWSSSDYITWPYNKDYIRKIICRHDGAKSIFHAGRKTVKMEAYWGFSKTIPEPIKTATIITAVRTFKRGMQAFADAGGMADLGQLFYVQQLDPQVKGILKANGYVKVVI